MSLSRSTQCLFCAFANTSRQLGRPARRKFTSTAKRSKQAPRDRTPVKAPEGKLPNYTAKEQQIIDSVYTPAQAAAIKAGEESIDPDLLEKQSNIRQDPWWRPNTFDDLKKIDPTIDKPVRAPFSNTDPFSRVKEEDELDRELGQMIKNLPDHEDPRSQLDSLQDFDKNLRLTVGKAETEKNPRSALAPPIILPGEPDLRGRIRDPKKQDKKRGQGTNSDEEEENPALTRLMQETGYSRQQIQRLQVKTVVQHRVVNQTRLGKISKMYYLSIAGNGDGLIGIGEGKSQEPSEARTQSQLKAIRNMKPILRYENRTIFGTVNAKVAATELELRSLPPGKFV